MFTVLEQLAKASGAAFLTALKKEPVWHVPFTILSTECTRQVQLGEGSGCSSQSP